MPLSIVEEFRGVGDGVASGRRRIVRQAHHFVCRAEANGLFAAIGFYTKRIPIVEPLSVQEMVRQHPRDPPVSEKTHIVTKHRRGTRS